MLNHLFALLLLTQVLAIDYGVRLPFSGNQHFPLYRNHVTIGPQTQLTAAHAIIYYYFGKDLTGNCPGDGSEPWWHGEPFERNGLQILIAPGYCDSRKSDELFTRNDWALVYSPQTKFSGDFLSLDLNSPTQDENLLIIGKGLDDFGSPFMAGDLKGAFYKVSLVEEGLIVLAADIPVRVTRPGDSGSPWLRMYDDGTVGVVAAHGGGFADYRTDQCHTPSGICPDRSTSYAGTFGHPRARQALESFTKLTEAGICGFNISCPSYRNPMWVRIGNLERDERGELLRLNQRDAILHCYNQGKHVPSNYEFAYYAWTRKAQGILEPRGEWHFPKSAFEDATNEEIAARQKRGYEVIFANVPNSDLKMVNFYYSAKGYQSRIEPGVNWTEARGYLWNGAKGEFELAPSPNELGLVRCAEGKDPNGKWKYDQWDSNLF